MAQSGRTYHEGIANTTATAATIGSVCRRPRQREMSLPSPIDTMRHVRTPKQVKEGHGARRRQLGRQEGVGTTNQGHYKSTAAAAAAAAAAERTNTKGGRENAAEMSSPDYRDQRVEQRHVVPFNTCIPAAAPLQPPPPCVDLCPAARHPGADRRERKIRTGRRSLDLSRLDRNGQRGKPALSRVSVLKMQVEVNP